MKLYYILYDAIFGNHPVIDNGEDKSVDALTEKIMGPCFASLRDNGRAAQKELQEKYSFERVFITSADGLRLSAHYCGNGAPGKTVILVHGHGATGFHDNSLKALRYLAAGYSVLIPDNRSCGESEGKFTTFGVKESDDILRWIKELIRRNPDVSVAVEGCSLGGAAVCMLSAKDLPQNVRALVSDCAFADFRDLLGYLAGYMAYLPFFPWLKGIDREQMKQSGVSFSEQNPVDYVKKATVPMLFVHGLSDRFIPAWNSGILCSACGSEEKDLLFIKGAGHAAASEKGGDTYFSRTLEFYGKYM